MKKFLTISMLMAAALLVMPSGIGAQRGPGKGPGKGPGGPGKGPGGRDKWKLPPLQIEDVKPEGAYEVLNLLPASGEQPRLGVSDELVYRLARYAPQDRLLKFATLNIETGALGSRQVKMPTDGPDLGDKPRMGFDGGKYAVVTRQAATVFVNVADEKAKIAAGIDPAVAEEVVQPKRKWGRGKGKDSTPPQAPEEYRVYAGANGMHALSVLIKYNAGSKQYSGNGAILHFAEERSVELEWSHAKYGIPPKDRDSVCAVTEDEVVVLVTNPRSAGAFDEACDLTCLVFDRKGRLKEAQTSPDPWAGNNASRFALSPNGKHIIAHPESGMHRFVVARGTWERGYETSYHDALIGFSPKGDIGVFLESDTTKRAAMVARNLETGEQVWRSSVEHADVEGERDDEPFTSVGPGAKVIAAQFGILKGEDSKDPVYLYRENAVDFRPICMSYDTAGKLVAVLASNRVFVIDAKSREEVNSIELETPLPEHALGEFVAFDEKSRKVMACARSHGVWVMDLKTNTIEKTLPALPGTWARPMPDFSGVVYSQSKEDGGNVMMQPIEGGDPTRIYRCEYKDAQAVCYFINDDADEFLVAEREIGVGRLFLVDDEGKTIVEYDIADEDPMLVGDNAITGFVTKRNQAVLISEITVWTTTGINCTVISPKEGGGALETSFSATFKTEELPGRSTYGGTSAAPFFGGLFSGDERKCTFACPAGALEVDISKNKFTLYAWSREPKGLAAVNPKGKEFFVAGSTGLTTYPIK